ncbi:MAG: HD domain-containing protein, partial [Oscillospiraceae bacterium]|nr:HD domain-containing protein [Oscillospiraceae bacterium]
VIEFLTMENGLSSDVIRRIVPDSGGGLFFVTENGLCYTTDWEYIRNLNNFAHYNNYNVIEGNQGELFVLSSAGIYIVDKAELLAGSSPLKYELLDSKRGLPVNLTPDAWCYIDENDNLYLPGNTGIVSINLNRYTVSTRSYRMLLSALIVDGETVVVEKGEPVSASKDAVKIEIVPEVINYSLNDPDIRVYLEGFDKEYLEIPHSELSSVVYTNLPSGEYTFHLAALDSRTGTVIAENVYRISKEKDIYDNWWFRLYVGLETMVIVAYLTWMIFKTQAQKTIRLHQMEMEWAKRQLQMGNETILTIAQAVDAKDERTSQHSLRVSEYSVLIAKKLGFNEEECENLRKIAMLHDIGKIGIPDRVLNKPAPLTDEEYAIMKSHVIRGAEILKNFTLIEHVSDGALYHHERYDGRGYANGLKGEDIPLNARIIGIADAFDAMTANRVYRKKLDLDFVINEMKKGSGTQFDPKLVDIMLGLIEDGTIDVERIYAEKQGEKKDEN